MNRVLIGGLLIGGFFQVQAANVAPCSPGVKNENIIPVGDGVITYCVSDFGWSDSFYLGSPTAPNPQHDLFSGDDALNLSYTLASGLGSGLGWLSPSLDAGQLTAQPVISKWAVLTTVHATGANSAQSVIVNPDGLQITITTFALGPGVSISLNITNTSSSVISNLQLADYFNFHPNGTQLNQDGTTYFSNGCIVTTGVPIDLSDGIMCGSAAPTKFDVGLATGPNAVWVDVQNNTYNNNTAHVGPADSAGALAWSLANLAPGGTDTFVISKNGPTGGTGGTGGSVPEPASFALLLVPLSLLMLLRRRSQA